MIDRTFRLLVRNYWSVFFVVASVSVPLQVVHATIWRNVIAVSELHADIEGFPPLRQVRSVGRSQLDHARLAQWVIWALLIVLIPLFVRATRRILETDARGEVTSARDAWRGAFGRGAPRPPGPGGRPRPGLVLVGLAAAIPAFLLLWGSARVLVEPLPDAQAFAGTGLALGASVAGAAPFLLVPAALASRRSSGVARPRHE